MNKLMKAESFKTTQMSESYSRLSQVLQNTNLRHASTNLHKMGEIEVYIPGIYVPNAETADMSKQPIICPGFEVNSEVLGSDEYEDYIVGWYFDDEDKLCEILLNEETAMKTTHPVFIICNANEEATAREKIVYGEPLIGLKSANTTYYDYSTCEYQINMRHESTGNSEFCITSVHIDEDGNAHRHLIDNGYTLWKKIAEVDKNDINKLLSHWEQFLDIEVEPRERNYTFWNTFERDWWISAKDLGSAHRNDVTIYLSGNMKYNSDWYAWDPSEVDSNPVDYTHFVSYWAKTYENDRGKLKLWKVVQ